MITNEIYINLEWAVPASKASARKIKGIFYGHCIVPFWIPADVLIYKGVQFKKYFFWDNIRFLGLKLLITTASHLQTSWQAVRYSKTEGHEMEVGPISRSSTSATGNDLCSRSPTQTVSMSSSRLERTSKLGAIETSAWSNHIPLSIRCTESCYQRDCSFGYMLKTIQSLALDGGENVRKLTTTQKCWKDNQERHSRTLTTFRQDLWVYAARSPLTVTAADWLTTE